MFAVFSFLLFFCCMGVYKLCKRLQCARLLGRGSRQRIEHSSDLPPSYSHRLESHDLSHDDATISGSIFRIGLQQAKRNGESTHDKNISSEKSPQNNDRSQAMKPTITYDKGYLNRFGGSTTQESMPGNGWRDSLTNLKGSTSPASSNTIQLKGGNTVSHYSIEDVL